MKRPGADFALEPLGFGRCIVGETEEVDYVYVGSETKILTSGKVP